MERSFSHLKIIKQGCCLSESSVEQLMRISIEEPIGAFEFEEIMEICKEHNNRKQL